MDYRFLKESAGYTPAHASWAKYTWFIYLRTNNSDASFWAGVLKDLLLRYNATGRARLKSYYRDLGMLTSHPSDYVLLRLKYLRSQEKFFEKQYGDPRSQFALFAIGGIVIFVAYMVKAALDLLSDNMDMVGLFYAIGARDYEALAPLIILYLYYLIPPVIVGFIGCGLIAREMWWYMVSLWIIFKWLSPLLLGSLLLSIALMALFCLIYVRRAHLARILAEEF